MARDCGPPGEVVSSASNPTSSWPASCGPSIFFFQEKEIGSPAYAGDDAFMDGAKQGAQRLAALQAQIGEY
jgi:hypothetical protein